MSFNYPLMNKDIKRREDEDICHKIADCMREHTWLVHTGESNMVVFNRVCGITESITPTPVLLSDANQQSAMVAAVNASLTENEKTILSRVEEVFVFSMI